MREAARRILFVTFDIIGPRLGGSAIRVLGLARALARAGFSVTITAPRVENFCEEKSVAIRAFDLTHPRETLRSFIEDADVVVLPLHALTRLPFLKHATIPLVVDIYDPALFELMETNADVDELRAQIDLQNQVLRRGDFFLCASERQRDYWSGELAANGRADSTNLIGVVPFGIDSAPSPDRDSGRTIFPASIRGGKIVIWPGGIWDWTDPLTLLQAMRILAQRVAEIHLIFFAGKHPNEEGFGTSMAQKARSLAEQLQLFNRSVHFIDDYIPYSERGKYLAACDVGVSTHRANRESHFAYRVRLLDCIWAGLPIVCTEGDVLAEMVARERLGLVVPPENAEALAGAIEQITMDLEFAESCRKRVVTARANFDWSDAVKPLAHFCAQPRIKHRDAMLADTQMLLSSGWRVVKKHGVKEAIQRLKQYLRNR